MAKYIARLMKSLSYRGCFKWLPGEIFLKVMFRLCLGYPLNLKNPKTFNEKIQWLKINNRNPLYTTLVDKYLVKEWVADKIGVKHIIPTLGVWEKFDDIDFDKLPNQFVLKCTHDSGSVVICKDKSKFDKVSVKKKIEKSLKINYYKAFREWPYKNVIPRIIAEQFMEVNPTIGLPDYKIFCFNGEPKIWFSITNRSNGDPRCDYFDLDGNHLPFVQCFKNNDVSIEKPSCLGEMLDFAKVLTAGIPLCRVDFYEVEGQVYFGELTFFESGGFEPFCPSEWDYKLGEMIKLQMK